MRQKIYISLLALFAITQVLAQEYEYKPFVREGVKWVCFYDHTYSSPITDQYFAEGRNYFTLEIKGDEIIGGKPYKAMHLYRGNGINPLNDTIPLYVREENRIVYGIEPEGHFYMPFIVGYGYTHGENTIYDMVYSGQEFVLYNFNDPENYYDSVFWREYDPMWDIHYLSYLSNDTIELGDNLAKRHIFCLHTHDFYIIEGVGYDGDHYSGYTLGYLWINLYPGHPYYLSHVTENGNTIYKGMHYDSNHWEHNGVDEVVTDKTKRSQDPRYYDLMGRAVGTEEPTTPGIYIHQGKKIVIR